MRKRYCPGRALAVAISTILIAAGCVKVQTGHSAEERRASSAERASAIRAEFAAQLRAASPSGKIDLLISEAQFVADRYQDFGRQFAREWREAEEGRGEPVLAEEMRTMIDRWLDSDKPILRAWDDNLESALEESKLSRVFDETLTASAAQYINRLYDLTSAVLYPSADIGEYLADIEDALRLLEQQEMDLQQELGRYR